jgi:hypothetical protein
MRKRSKNSLLEKYTGTQVQILTRAVWFPTWFMFSDMVVHVLVGDRVCDGVRECLWCARGCENLAMGDE